MRLSARKMTSDDTMRPAAGAASTSEEVDAVTCGSAAALRAVLTFGGESCAATHPIALVYDVNRAVMSAFGDLNFVTCAVAALAYGPRCVSVCPRWAFVK